MAHDSRPIAAVDIGSNSVFLFVAQPRADGSFRIIHRDKARARLAAHVRPDGRLSPAAIDAAVATLSAFRDKIAALDAEPIYAATAAVRGAANRDEFLATIRERAGVAIRVLDGADEARTMYRGVRHGGLGAGETILCVDVGGGSTELALGDGDRPDHVASAAIGAVQLTVAHLAAIPPSREAVRSCEKAVADALGSLIEPFRSCPKVAIATSGTVQRVARIVALQQRTAFASGMTIDAAEFSALSTRLAACQSLDERLAIPGMDPQRADVLLGGMLVYTGLARLLGLQGWRVSVPGLRSGLVAGVMDRRRGKRPPWRSPVRT